MPREEEVDVIPQEIQKPLLTGDIPVIVPLSINKKHFEYIY